VSAAALAPFAWELARVMAQSAPADALGAFHSAVLRSEKTRVEIRALPAPAGPSQILVVAGSDTSRPGLARLQVERTAARLSEA
jgi:stage V sporulation protein SpoVS